MNSKETEKRGRGLGCKKKKKGGRGGGKKGGREKERKEKIEDAKQNYNKVK